MRTYLILIGCLFVTHLGTAQESPDFHACGDKATTQMAINACAGDEAKRADAELNRVYGQLLLKAEKDPVATAKIKAAEKLWIAYRDAYIEAMYPAEDKQAAYGTMYSMETSLLIAKMSRQHTSALKELLRQHDGGEGNPSKSPIR